MVILTGFLSCIKKIRSIFDIPTLLLDFLPAIISILDVTSSASRVQIVNSFALLSLEKIVIFEVSMTGVVNMALRPDVKHKIV